MKRTIAALSLVLSTAFGITSAAFAIELPSEKVEDQRIVSSVAGQLGEIKVESAEAPASGIWTTVEVQYLIPCYRTLESVALSYGYTNEGIAVYSSAFASGLQLSSERFVCQAFQIVSRSVTIPGFVAASDIRLVNLYTAPKTVPVDTIAISPIAEAHIVAVEPLCPTDTECGLNGSILLIELRLNSCVSQLGPIASHVDTYIYPNDAMSHRVVIHGLEFVNKASMVARCTEDSMIAYTTISVPNVFGPINAFELVVLQ